MKRILTVTLFCLISSLTFAEDNEITILAVITGGGAGSICLLAYSAQWTFSQSAVRKVLYMAECRPWFRAQ